MPTKILPPLDILQRYSIKETNAYLRQSRAKTYQDIKNGKIAVIRDGRRVYVSGAVIASRSTGESA